MMTNENNLPEYVVVERRDAHGPADCATFIDNLGDAIRYWDASRYEDSKRGQTLIEGGIAIREYNAKGECTRDGWLIHVFDGHIYLNPTIRC